MPNLARGTAQCRFDSGDTYGNITAVLDTGDIVTNMSDCVLKKGDYFSVSPSSSSLLISFTAGNQAKIGGAFFILKQSASLTLPSNTHAFICLEINKSNQDGSKGDIVVKTASQIQQGDLFGNGTVRDYPIYEFTTNATGVSQMEFCGLIVGNTYGPTESQYESLNLENYATYFIYED